MTKALQFLYSSNTYFYISCLHKNHDRDFIYKPRGFNSIKEHDEVLKERWNNVVPEDGIVFSLGDTVFGHDAVSQLLDVFKNYNFKELYLSPGNHISGWKQLYYKTLWDIFKMKDQEVYPLYHKVNDDKTVIFMPNYYEIFIGYQMICLSHYPILSHNNQNRESWAISGHTHSNFEFTRKTYPRGKRVEVCVESFGYPVSHEEIASIMETKTLDNWDHHSAS